MKKITLALLTAGIAFGGSAFKNVHKSITANFLVQKTAGIYYQSTSRDGICFSVASLPCSYVLTLTGLVNIPNQTSYTAITISSYLSSGYILPESTGNKLYIGN